MSIRIFEFTVTDKSIAVTNLQRGGVQGEKNATRLDFSFEDGLKDKLIELSDDGKQLFYRFDLYDGVGGKISTDPVALDLNNETTVSHMIAEWQTRYGGTIQVYLVITLTDGEKTEMELYSYCVKMALKPLPDAKSAVGESYESITTLAVSARASAENSRFAADEAKEAYKKTQDALDNGIILNLDGNRGKAEGNIKYVVDNAMSDTSQNAVQNKVVKAYVDEKNTNLKGSIGTLIKEALKAAKLEAHPIGSYYWSENDINPSELFGGEWEQIKDRFVLAVGDVYAKSGSVGGAFNVTLKPEHTPKHLHSIAINGNNLGDSVGGSYVLTTNTNKGHTYKKPFMTPSLPLNPILGIDGLPIPIEPEAVDITNPYVTAYCWKRIA